MQSLSTINNQLSRLEADIQAEDKSASEHENDAVANAGDNDARAALEGAAAVKAKSKRDALLQQKAGLEAQKQQLERELADTESKIIQNEAEHRTLVDRKLALKG